VQSETDKDCMPPSSWTAMAEGRCSTYDLASPSHRARVAALRRVAERAPHVGISCPTVFAFSSDNGRRPTSEVQGILGHCAPSCVWRLNGCGNPARGSRSSADAIDLAKSIVREIDKAECATAARRTLHVRVAIDCSSRDAIRRSAGRHSRPLE
jgi:undecaprenyl diphosphate synthase